MIPAKCELCDQFRELADQLTLALKQEREVNEQLRRELQELAEELAEVDMNGEAAAFAEEHEPS